MILLSSHFAAHQDKVDERNKNYATITRNLRFENSREESTGGPEGPDGDLPGGARAGNDEFQVRGARGARWGRHAAALLAGVQRVSGYVSRWWPGCLSTVAAMTARGCLGGRAASGLAGTCPPAAAFGRCHASGGGGSGPASLPSSVRCSSSAMAARRQQRHAQKCKAP
jgi:hypothetical protein